MSNTTGYISPFSTRYASKEMQYLFSTENRPLTFRRLWIALAEAEQQAGLPITDEQIAEMKEHAEDLDLELAAQYEKKLRHDVMAHIHAWGDVCPKARPNLTPTSCACFFCTGKPGSINRTVSLSGESCEHSIKAQNPPCIEPTVGIQPSGATSMSRKAFRNLEASCLSGSAPSISGYCEAIPERRAAHSASMPTAEGGRPGMPISRCRNSVEVNLSSLRPIAPD